MFHDFSPEKVVTGREDNGAGQRGKVVRGILDAVTRRLSVLPPGDRLVLAVSGGPDSMVLLDTVARCAPERVAAVATFDHRSGAHSARGVEVVAGVARARSLRLVVGAARAPMPAAREAEWREERWRFLRQVASEEGAHGVATGHHLDDQVETVCMRLLRGAGARGLAGLDVDNGVVRPLLGEPRARLRAYVEERALPTVDDPSNADRRTLRARVRHDVLPALEEATPGFRDWLLALGTRAAGWRRGVESWVAALPLETLDHRSLVVPLAVVRDVEPTGLAVLWPAVLARVNVVADRRGTERLARFTTTGEPGRTIQLAGGGTVRRLRDGFLVSGKRPMDDVTP